MLVLGQGRGHPCWRMLLVIVILSGLVRHCEPRSTKRLTDPSPLSSPTLSRNSAESRSQQNLGSPSELAWQAWLLVDSQTGAHSSLDSATFLRRITPKSVFIAPALPPCAEGYQADTMGRCVKNVVNINHEAHLDFLLQRLNSRYRNRGAPEANPSNNNQKKSSGPLQLNIPLLSDTDTNTSQVDHEETRDSISIVIPPRGQVRLKDEEQPLIINKLLIAVNGNQTSAEKQEIEPNFFRYNGTASVDTEDRPSSRLDTVVPVTELVSDATTATKFVEDTSTVTKFVEDTSTVTKFVEDTAPSTRFLEDTTSEMEYVNDATPATKSVDDTTTVTETVDETATVTKSVNDTTPVTKAVDDSTLVTGSVDDSTLVTESTDDTTSVTKLVDDTASGTRTADNATSGTMAVDDTTSATGSIDDAGTVTKSVNDAAPVTESVEDSSPVTESFEDVARVMELFRYLQ